MRPEVESKKEMERPQSLTVYLRITCRVVRESEQDEAEGVVQPTLQQEVHR